MRSETNKKQLVLTIGGFDPSSGAGITTDLKVLEQLGAYGLSAISAITIQNSEAVFDVFTPGADIFKHQLEALFSDIAPSVIKLGMLSNKESVLVLKEQLLKLEKKRLVVDPIFVSTSGMTLLNSHGRQALLDHILPLTLILTPNINEAELISGIKINSLADAQRAASIINDLGPKWVIIKGGHHQIDSKTVEDLVYNGVDFFVLKNERIDKNVRGTGCIFSSAIAAYLTSEPDELEAIKKARAFVQEKIEQARKIGQGREQI